MGSLVAEAARAFTTAIPTMSIASFGSGGAEPAPAPAPAAMPASGAEPANLPAQGAAASAAASFGAAPAPAASPVHRPLRLRNSPAILFAGSDPIALPALTRLAERGWVAAVLSAPQRPKGRGRAGGRTASDTPVGAHARAHGLPLLCYERLDQAACDDVARRGCAMLICVAYGRYFPSPFLALFASGTMNLHPSLLPRFRGASPIPAVLLAGDSEGGVSIIEIAKELDGGDVLAQARRPLDDTTARDELEQWCAERGAELIVGLVEQAMVAGVSAANGGGSGAPNGSNRGSMGGAPNANSNGSGVPNANTIRLPHGTPQRVEEAVWCGRITRAHGRIEWSLPAELILCQIRAFQRWPGSFTTAGSRRLIIHRASMYEPAVEAPVAECGIVRSIDRARGICVQTGRGIIAVERLQLEYRSPCDWREFTAGHPEVVGTRWG